MRARLRGCFSGRNAMNRRIFVRLAIALGALASSGCSHGGDGDKAGPAAAASITSTSAIAAPQQAAPAATAKDDWESSFPDNPPEKFTDGEKAFARVREAILKDYYLTGLTDDEIYRAAAQGILEHVDPKMHKWNKLLSPSEVAQVRSDLKGELIGIGVHIHFDPATGHIDVQGVQSGSPADKAGLLTGDLIVSVNGKHFKGMGTMDVVSAIRGKAGEPVTVSVLRDDKIVPFTIVREVVTMADVDHKILGDRIGYMQFHAFSAKTVPMLKAALADLAAKQPKALVIDLRANQGGSFDDAIASAEQFLPSGTPIVKLKKRDGKEETIVSKGDPSMANLPILVLVGHGTSSGAEFLTAALAEGRRARVVGGRTYGKWSVQAITDLPNGYAFKLTTAQFFTPSGKTFDGVGLTPDVEVDMSEEQIEKVYAITDADKRLAADPQLRTAVSILNATP
jgi:carboxyl-terminal processing protease